VKADQVSRLIDVGDMKDDKVPLAHQSCDIEDSPSPDVTTIIYCHTNK